MSHADKFRFSIDRGGTFTDIYAEVPGEPGFRVLKLLSENPDQYSDAPSEGIHRILGEVTGTPHPSDGFDTGRIEWIRMGTTVATNALLERKGAPTALVITKGFRDLLRIGKQNRPRIFDLEIKKPDLPYGAVVEVDERIRLGGRASPDPRYPQVQGVTGETVEILQAPDLVRIRPELEELLERGICSLAIVLMHSYIYPAHELEIGALAEELGFSHVSLSSQVMPRIKMVDRGQTCCVDAYLTPGIQDYLEGFRSRFKGGEPELFFMQSDGGLVRADSFKGSQAILSGPAAGVVGYAMTTFHGDFSKPVIGFDMGGTSTDVSRFDGEYEWVHETETGGVHLMIPQLDIKTVAAGGGSRLFYRNGMFQVGPESSGAYPGPVCYRNGGPLSLTDANLLMGRLLPNYFPKIFGPHENLPLDEQAACKAFEDMTRKINSEVSGGTPMSPEEVAYGFVEVANETMVRSIREISVARGYDIREHVLACFGGAGGQHACAIARGLGIRKIVIHRFAGVLSAYGLGLADVVVEKQEPASQVFREETLPLLLGRLEALTQKAVEEIKRQGDYQLEIRRYLNMRYRGSDTAAMVLEPPNGDFEREFIRAHKREYGFEMAGREILVDDLRVRVSGKPGSLKTVRIPRLPSPTPPISAVRCYFEEGWLDAAVYLLDSLGACQELKGPAIILHKTSTIILEPGCSALITDFGDVEIEVSPPPKRSRDSKVDPVQLSLFGNRFMSIAEQMGRTLQRTAISTNIKERQDFSCAIFGPEGDLVANAPHQPVHLGAMGEAVRQQIRLQGPDIQPGDVWVTNHPSEGGSHLPDITVITPVIAGGWPVFFVASRGHHADVGGITPGSMPPFSQTLVEEGACIQSFKLVENGVFQEKEITGLLQAPAQVHRLPGLPPISGTRALADNLSDLKAQVAANRKGIELLNEMIRSFSLEGVQAYMQHLQENARKCVENLLKDLSRSRGLRAVDTLEAEDYLDDGVPIRLCVMIDRNEGKAIFDFSGTGPQVPGNLNAPRAVTTSAILYCLRCLIDSDIPLNQGCLSRIQVVIREGSLLAPSGNAAVAAGNVLTSQRLTDVIFKAFGACAASQGCMNNLTFGNEHFGYYETIGGGAGAGPHWHGQSGVHTHMTNTRITDPEVLEKRYPVLLREFSIRRGSGGKGRFRGGDGLVREIEFLQPLTVSILSERRVYAPYGLAGGHPGAKGKNIFLHRDGTETDLGGKNQVQAQPGDRIRILTPGGGGYGKP